MKIHYICIYLKVIIIKKHNGMNKLGKITKNCKKRSKLYRYGYSASLKYKIVISYLKIGNKYIPKYQSSLEFNDKETNEGLIVK